MCRRHLAVGGDWNAIKKCLELRERYSDYREKTLAALMDEALALRGYYRDNQVPVPAHIEKFLDGMDRHIAEGQHRAA